MQAFCLHNFYADMRTIEFTAGKDENEKSIRDFLRGFGVSTALLKKLKMSENGILLNGIPARTIDLLSEGDVLTINIENRGEMPEPSDTKVHIVYEDGDIIVVNKPPFMPVHESRNHRGDALSNAVSAVIKEKNTAFRAVYRLDRDTSGVVLIAKNELAACKLAGKIEKDYYAVVSGEIPSEGTVDAPIARENSSIIKRCVREDGERAVTHWSVVSRKNEKALLKLRLETGRTHQIRVHLSHIGFPLLGDSLYGGDCSEISRQALQCCEIRFVHPVYETEMCLSCELDNDIKGLVY